MHPTQRASRIHAHGTDIYWEEAGEGRPLVLVHGLCDSGRTYSRVVRRLAQHRRVIIVDLPGHGYSGRPSATYSLDWYAEVMAAWLNRLDLDDFDLVGHSLGGGIAQRLLLERTGRIRRLALVASGGLGREVNWLLRLASLPAVVEYLGQPLMRRATRLGTRICGGDFLARDREHLSRANGRAGTARALARTVRSVIDLKGQRMGFAERVHELEHIPPIAVFWGDRDPILPASHADALKRQLSGVRVVRFNRCGHYPHREAPEQFSAALLRFLEEPQPVPKALGRRPAEAAAPASSRPARGALRSA